MMSCRGEPSGESPDGTGPRRVYLYGHVVRVYHRLDSLSVELSTSKNEKIPYKIKLYFRVTAKWVCFVIFCFFLKKHRIRFQNRYNYNDVILYVISHFLSFYIYRVRV